MTSSYHHPSAIVETELIGEGTRIWAFAHILKGAKIGAHCNIGDHNFIEGGAIVGDRVTIKNANMIWEGITLEDGVFVGPHVFFTNDLYPRSPRLEQARFRYEDHGWFRPTRVCQGASLGAGAVILAGITIGAFCTVGAGAVVTRDTQPYSLVTGNPAHARGWVCECGLRIKFAENSAICEACGLKYKKDGDGIRKE